MRIFNGISNDPMAGIVKQFREAAGGACRWMHRNALNLSGWFGVAAGGWGVAAGASSFNDPQLIVAGVLEWTSFGTNALLGQQDRDEEGAAVVPFSLTKGVIPWKYPMESFLLQQGVCGLFYLGAGLNWKVIESLAGKIAEHPEVWANNHVPIVKVSGLVVQGALCSMAPLAGNFAKNGTGVLHPRVISSAFLAASSVVLGIAAAQTGSVFLGAGAGCFIASNVLSAISRRRATVSNPALG